jgi:hypothetical protein
MSKNQSHTHFLLGSQTIPHFDYEEYGINGVGKNRQPIISMDQYIDHSKDKELHIECCKGLAVAEDIKMGMVYGALPPEEVLRFGGRDCWTKMLKDIEKYDPTGIHKKTINELVEQNPGKEMQVTYKYAYFAMGAVIPWFFALYLKKNDFRSKTQDLGQWTESAKHFPQLIEYLETLPFKTIGRVLLFTTYPQSGVAIHRDSIVAEHSDHNINLFFDGGWRPSFIWNEKTKEKVYLQKDARSYFFNNRDYHGVDPENVFRYTLRIDGTFTDELCEQLGLEEGKTWKWNYLK